MDWSSELGESVVVKCPNVDTSNLKEFKLADEQLQQSSLQIHGSPTTYTTSIHRLLKMGTQRQVEHLLYCLHPTCAHSNGSLTNQVPDGSACDIGFGRRITGLHFHFLTSL